MRLSIEFRRARLRWPWVMYDEEQTQVCGVWYYRLAVFLWFVVLEARWTVYRDTPHYTSWNWQPFNGGLSWHSTEKAAKRRKASEEG